MVYAGRPGWEFDNTVKALQSLNPHYTFDSIAHLEVTKASLREEWEVFEEISRRAIERYAEGITEEKPKTYSLENK